MKSKLKKLLVGIKEFIIYSFTEQREDGFYKDYMGRVEVVKGKEVIYDSHFEPPYHK